MQREKMTKKTITSMNASDEIVKKLSICVFEMRSSAEQIFNPPKQVD